jgi:hypothetical protein
MEKRTRRFLLLAAAGMIAAALTPAVWTSDVQPAPEALASTAAEERGALLSPAASIIVPSCIPGTRLTCDELPVPFGSTCSCSTRPLDLKCRVCGGGRGFQYQTTCTVQQPCTNSPCDLNALYTRTALSCE